MAALVLFNKPYQVLSQFTDNQGRQTLATYITQQSIYPAGRLDYDSEGLLLLTDNGNLQHQISHPKHKLPKTYWVQVEGDITEQALDQLRKGLELNDGRTKPAKVWKIDEPKLWQRNPPIRFRKNSPTSWLEITINEGKNRQIRRMTAAVKLPTLRLIRQSVGQWTLDTLKPGELKIETIHLQSSNTKLNKRRYYRPEKL